jgi:hypothetical protein
LIAGCRTARKEYPMATKRKGDDPQDTPNEPMSPDEMVAFEEDVIHGESDQEPSASKEDDDSTTGSTGLTENEIEEVVEEYEEERKGRQGR